VTGHCWFPRSLRLLVICRLCSTPLDTLVQYRILLSGCKRILGFLVVAARTLYREGRCRAIPSPLSDRVELVRLSPLQPLSHLRLPRRPGVSSAFSGSRAGPIARRGGLAWRWGRPTVPKCSPGSTESGISDLELQDAANRWLA